MRRRNFISLVGSAAAWPLAVRAQQSATPVIGLLSGIDVDDRQLAAIRQGLSEAGYLDGKSVAIEYRSAAGQYDRFTDLGGRAGAAPSRRDRYNPRHYVGTLG
jgi:putative ABC transport system substrate-binding protein